MLVQKYEMFHMKQNESIISIFTRFTYITNCLKNLGRIYSNSDYVKKILRSLPRAWEAKVTAIQETKDLSTLPLEELLGSLMIHELMMQQKSEDESKRKKVIALKATSAKKEDDEDSGSGEEKSNIELAHLTKKFRRFRKSRGPPKEKPIFKKNQSRGKEKEKRKKILGHVTSARSLDIS